MLKECIYETMMDNDETWFICNGKLDAVLILDAALLDA